MKTSVQVWLFVVTEETALTNPVPICVTATLDGLDQTVI